MAQATRKIELTQVELDLLTSALEDVLILWASKNKDSRSTSIISTLRLLFQREASLAN